MPSAKQIKARKAFVKKYAKKKKSNPRKKKSSRKPSRTSRNGKGLIPAFQIPIGYDIGDRKTQQRLMKRYITKGNKYQKEKMFRKWQGSV